MPGAYAHITLVNLAKEPKRLDKIDGFPRAASGAIYKYFKFCELGCVSPDYPYLVPMDAHQNAWADFMHYQCTGDNLKVGAKIVRALAGEDQRKAFAWLCGFAAHIATDVTIHPIVERKVGPYAQNKMAHRRCEMHQDSYIFQRMNLGGIGLSEHLKSGIWGCCSAPNSGNLDQVVSGLWRDILKTSYPAQFAARHPNIDKWHQSFKNVVDKIGEEGYQLVPLARHVAVNCGLTYPLVTEIDYEFIKELKTPEGPQHYDAIFDRAIVNVTNVWRLLAGGVFSGENAYMDSIGNWNLDTGCDENGKLVFWKIK